MTSRPLNFVPPSALREVRAGRVVTLKYALFDADNDALIEYRHDLHYLHGGTDTRLLKLQQAVEGMRAGMKTTVQLSAEEAFGAVDGDLILRVPTAALPAEALKPGAMVDGEAPDGRVQSFRVVRVDGDSAEIDGNHPLAGRALRFVVEVAAVRQAGQQELETGRALLMAGDASAPTMS